MIRDNFSVTYGLFYRFTFVSPSDICTYTVDLNEYSKNLSSMIDAHRLMRVSQLLWNLYTHIQRDVPYIRLVYVDYSMRQYTVTTYWMLVKDNRQLGSLLLT